MTILQTSKLFNILIAIFIALSYFPILVQSLDYSANYTLNCNQLHSLTSDTQLPTLWNIIILHQIDQYMFMILCPIIFIMQLIILYNYKSNQSLLVRPGNIFCGLIIIELVLNLCLFATAIYHTIFSDYEPMPASFPYFCPTISVIFIFFEISHFSYLAMFLVFTIVNFRFSLRKRPKNFWRFLHAAVIFITLGLTMLLYFDDFTGPSYYGICEMTLVRKPTWYKIMPWFSIGISIIFTIGGIFTLVYFRKHIPKTSTFQRRKSSQHRTISLIVIGFSFFMLSFSTIQLVLDLNCISEQPNADIGVLITLVNFARILQYFFLVFIILRNGLFRTRLKKTLKRIFQGNQRQPFLDKQYLADGFVIEELAFNERLLTMKQKSNQIDLLLTSQIYTIISGIYIAHNEYHRETKLELIKPLHYKEKISFKMDNDSALNYETEARMLLRLKILKCSVQLHAPKVFHKILLHDGIKDIDKSFEIVQNSRKIWNSIEGRGGKSGQFFYFSSDNKFVLKTITPDQFDFLMQNLQQFSDYYQKNPDSLLAKIYGVFTIKGDEIQRSFRLILMKNILGCPKDQILRMYDMKGSKYDRQVIKETDQLQNAHKLTLKDTDFINYEGRLDIPQELAIKVRNSLQKDANFLKNYYLIDYSLLVVKVRWFEAPDDPTFWSPLQRIQHSKNSNQYYHIGVIDYMQKWDFQKKGEKWWKNLLGKKDVSAANPNAYEYRFNSFINEITINQLPKVELSQMVNEKSYPGEDQYNIKVRGVNKQFPQSKPEKIVTSEMVSIDIQKLYSNEEEKPQKITRDSSDLRPESPFKSSKQQKENKNEK